MMVPVCSARGYTLIETLVAFMILALSFAVLMRIFSGGLGSVAIARDYSHALSLAQSQIAAAGVTEPLSRGESSGSWDERFHWREVVAPYRPWEAATQAELPVSAYLVSVTVEWKRQGRDRRVHLETVRLQPEAKPGERS